MKRLMIAVAMLAMSAPAAAQDWRTDERYERGERIKRGRGDERGREGRRRRGGGSARTFETPRLGGFALHICPRDTGFDGLLRGRCGIPVANEFCRLRCFAEAVDAPETGGLGPTRRLDGAVVDHPWVTGFRYITCER